MPFYAASSIGLILWAEVKTLNFDYASCWPIILLLILLLWDFHKDGMRSRCGHYSSKNKGNQND